MNILKVTTIILFTLLTGLVSHANSTKFIPIKHMEILIPYAQKCHVSEQSNALIISELQVRKSYNTEHKKKFTNEDIVRIMRTVLFNKNSQANLPALPDNLNPEELKSLDQIIISLQSTYN